MLTEGDINKLAHESLLQELHNIDNIAETFARTAILILVALLAFVSTVRTQEAIWVSSGIGMFLSALMIFKAWRHRRIFIYCYKRISVLQKRLGINAIREFPEGKPFLLCWLPDGFSLLGWLGIAFLIVWVVVLVTSWTCGFFTS